MNVGSSRSHSVFTLQVIRKDQQSNHTTQSKVNLVDLAGSEKITKTHATGSSTDLLLSLVNTNIQVIDWKKQKRLMLRYLRWERS